MLKSGISPVLRAIRLLWGRMGAARFYVLAAAAVIIFLAVEGTVHLARERTQSTPAVKGRTTSSEQEEFSRTMPPPKADDATSDNSLIAITNVASRKKFGRHGAGRVDVKIGVTPQPNLRNGQVEIRVFFYDVTPSREMRPTPALVSYQWITPVRDWTDPSPKYLIATYFRPRERRPSAENLQYGGFIVRVYFDGQLQDEKSEPEGVLAALRSGMRSVPAPAQAESPAIAAAAVPNPGRSQAALPKTETTPISLSPTASPTTSEKRTAQEIAALPYGRPVPGKSGFVYSPYNEKFLIDVRGAPPGTVVTDPNSGKAFRVP